MTDDTLKRIAAGVEYLTHRQNGNGSWGVPSDLDIDRFVTTCQVLTLLLDIGYSPSSRLVRRAVEYLLRFESDGPIVSYWKLEPFARLAFHPHYSPKVGPVIDSDLGIVHQTVQIGAGSPKPRTICLPLFGLKILRLLKRKQGDWDQLFVRHALEQWDIGRKNFWGTPDVNSMAMTWLEPLEWPAEVKDRKSETVALAMKTVKESAQRTDAGVHWDNRVATTAFVCLDVAESLTANGDVEMRTLIQEAQRWLLSRQARETKWELSETQKKRAVRSNEYYTAVALRGIVASMTMMGESISPSLWAEITESHRKKAILATSLAAVLGLVIIGYGIWSLVSALHVGSSIIMPAIEVITGIAGTVPFVQSAIRWIRDRVS